MTATANEIAGAMRAGRSHRSASPPVRSAAGIAKRFDATVALSASNLSIDAGEPVALMGENGAGKSTFVKILSGVLRPDGGTPTLRGSRVHCGAGGYNEMAPTLPGGRDDFIALVLPELRLRGLFRSDDSGSTLRDHFGLPGPAARRTLTVPGASAVAAA
ncbi:hypothetical protein WI38_02075 [Burkholderia ubonensis]|uniref:ABC transporter domain-containing protein n=1 Tax=Burkholderia ubonensis TaxID=101571 RepID=A0A102JYR0_9BURK|nr:hypothetical protein WI35_23510 [Burkholderia ubonensis]KUZ79863.1 hypothetical protein WI38_02075 [Burkholderia ubonensis]KUZ93404.1 hypothetical protein WI39_15770 [Burkholderia ubonensis]